jgi:hypothetical protein
VSKKLFCGVRVSAPMGGVGGNHRPLRPPAGGTRDHRGCISMGGRAVGKIVF